MKSSPALRHRRSIEQLESRLMLALTVPAGFSSSTYSSNIGGVTAMAIAPDGRMFVSAEAGQLRVIDKNGTLLPDPFLTVTTNTDGERGLLGVALDPNFESNHFLYCYYTATTPALHNRVSRFTANGNVVEAGSEVVLIDLPNLGAIYHNGGPIHFGPDGKLYIGTGDNTVPSNSQSLGTTLGKILRINSDGSIPDDNPFHGVTTGNNQAIWALGLRNPYTFAFQPGANRMFINDVGQDTWEEVDDGIAGSNYGWPYSEGLKKPGDTVTSIGTYRDPLHTYDHSVGKAIVGGVFYNPAHAMFPQSYVGKYFFQDDIFNWLKTMDTTSNAVTDFGTGSSSPVDLQIGRDGTLYLLQRGDGGSILAIRSTSVQGHVFNDANSNGTQDAGETGLFDWTVYDDANNNGEYDVGEEFDATDADGLYVLGGLSTGNHNVRAFLPSGYRKTNPAAGTPGYNVALAAGDALLDKNFGATTNILLAGTVYNDANSNGKQDAGENALEGVVVSIISNEQIVAQRTTNEFGFWQVKGLSAGTGSAEVGAEGWTPIFPVNGIYQGSMTSGERNQNLNFGLKEIPAPVPMSVFANTIPPLLSGEFEKLDFSFNDEI